MLASALALASFSAAAVLACSSAVGLASAALGVAALDFAVALALGVLALDLVVLGFALVALALADEDLLALDFDAALAFLGSAAANNSSAAAERSLALVFPVRAVRAMLPAVLVAYAVGFQRALRLAQTQVYVRMWRALNGETLPRKLYVLAWRLLTLIRRLCQ